MYYFSFLTASIATYCFKPRVLSHFLYSNSQQLPSHQAKVIMWSDDASTRFMEDPSLWAKHMLHDEIDFVARTTAWNVPGQTHDKTFEYFGLNR